MRRWKMATAAALLLGLGSTALNVHALLSGPGDRIVLEGPRGRLVLDENALEIYDPQGERRVRVRYDPDLEFGEVTLRGTDRDRAMMFVGFPGASRQAGVTLRRDDQRIALITFGTFNHVRVPEDTSPPELLGQD